MDDAQSMQWPDDIQVVAPKQTDLKIIAMTSPVYKNKKTDKKYDALIKESIDRVNQMEEVLARDKGSLAHEFQKQINSNEPVQHGGSRVMTLFHANGARRAQETVELFESFKGAGSYYVLDIETFGDSHDRQNAFGLNEISINKYDKDGNMVEAGYNAVIRQDKDMLEDLRKSINELKSNKYAFNDMPEYMKRSLIDLMRFSKYKEDTDAHAFIQGKNMKHHSIISSVFNEQDQADYGKVLREMDMYLKYMESGLETMEKSSNGVVTGKTAMKRVAAIMESNPDAFFITYNGNAFDMPALRAFAEKMKVKLPDNVNHLDYMNLIQTAFMDSDELKMMMNPEFVKGHHSKDKLAAYVKDTLGIMDGGEHNAKVDVDNTAKVVAASYMHIDDKLNQQKGKTPEGYQLHPSHMTWDPDSELKAGHELFATSGVQAYKEGDASFRMKMNENGKWVTVSNGFNNTVINSKSFYQFAGHVVGEEVGEGNQAFKFYDPDRKEYAYIVRSGEHAFSELQDFVQQRFYNWSNVEPTQRRQIIHAAESDRARRRYDRYFSLDGAGSGLTVNNGDIVERGTSGFSGLKRMLSNAAIMEEHLQSNKNVKERVEQLMAQGMSRNQAKRQVRSIRSHELLDRMDFMSTWDPETGTYTFNQAEKDQFFKMYGRLIEERPVLEKAIEAIDSEFKSEIEKVSAIKDGKERNAALKLINQKRDQALMRYNEQLTRMYTPQTEVAPVAPYEVNRLNYFNPSKGDSGSINFESVESAQIDIYRYGKRGIKDGPNRPNQIRDNISHLMGILHGQGVLEKEQYNAYMISLHENQSPWHAAKEIALDMRMNSSDKFSNEREVPVINSNKAIEQVDQAINMKFIEQAISDTQNSYMTIDNGKVQLSQALRDQLTILDEEHFSRLNPNNFAAIEELLTSVQKHAGGRSITLGLDEKNATLKAYVFDSENSVPVMNQLHKGRAPGNALEITLPLISRSGTQRVGNLVLNAHQSAVYEDGEVKVISSSQKIAKEYASKMYTIMDAVKEGDYERANQLAARTLRNEVEEMSGIQRNMVGGANDNMLFSNTAADTTKQAHIKLGNAMIESLYYSQDGFDGLKLTEKDFYDWEEVSRIDSNTGKRVLKKGVTLDSVVGDTRYQLLMKMPAWAEKNLPDLELSTSGLKAEQVSRGTMSTEDLRHRKTYGKFYNHGRDNLVQYLTSYTINSDVEEKLRSIPGVSLDTKLTTQRELDYIASGDRQRESFNVKTGYMTQDELRGRYESLYNTDEGKKLFEELGYLDDQGRLEVEKLPRLYEQQGIIASDLSEALEVDNEKRYDKGSQFEINKRLELGSTVEPGDELGVRIHENGERETVRYLGKKTGHLVSGVTGDQDLIVRWQTDPFKAMLDGEKMTDSPMDRRLLQAITGSDDISVLMNADVVKHKDIGMIMSGEARLLQEQIQGLSGKQRDLAIKTIERAGVGLKFDRKKGYFIDKSFDQDIEIDAFKNLYAKLNSMEGLEGVTFGNRTSTGVLEGILEMRLSKVSNYSRSVDHTGRAVLGFKPDGTPIYGDKGGVQWGHRELGVLNSYAQTDGVTMSKTRQHVLQTMVEQSQRLDEAVALKESLRYLSERMDGSAQGINPDAFRSLPEEHRTLLNIKTEDGTHTVGSYKGTVFDKSAIQQLGQGTGAVNEHGFWMNLPTVKRQDGTEAKITIKTGKDQTREIDKLFIPFTDLDGKNGKVFMRDLQRHISSIFEKAAAVESKSKDSEDALSMHRQLQTEVDKYMKQSFKDLTSSKGTLFNEGFKASMGTSSSGLFKLMDYETSQKMTERFGEGQFTLISEETAKKMGIFNQLKEGKEMFTANIRYPTFHDGAMQFTRIQMAEWVKDGEFHTTSFSSMLQNADSDGDYSHIVVVDDEEVQKEWKAAHDNREKKYGAQWEEHLKKEALVYNSNDTMSIEGASNAINEKEGGRPGFIPSSVGNSDEEMAAKIGKMTIGRASDLNLFIRQAADNFYPDGGEINQKIKAFGQGLEQKLIDAKHGAKPAGLKMIDAIYAGDWNKVSELDEAFFGNMFKNKYHLDTVSRELPLMVSQMSEGLKTKGLKFGTSTGVSYNYAIDNLIDIIQGTASPEEYGGKNAGLAAFQEYLQATGEDIQIGGTQEYTQPIQRHADPTMAERVGVDGMMNRTRNIASDMVGGNVGAIKEKVASLWSDLGNMSTKKKAIAAGGLAIGGLAGYNILNTEKPVMHYNEEQELPSGQNQVNPRNASPALDMPQETGRQNANIQIRATGQGVSKDALSTSVTNGLQGSGMNAGPTRVSVNTTDNTQQLNRQWYRDKVRENI